VPNYPAPQTDNEDPEQGEHLAVFGALGRGATERNTMKTPAILVIVALLLTACSSGGGGHVRYIPSPTPHKVVMIR
jgi:hypothetical protein